MQTPLSHACSTWENCVAAIRVVRFSCAASAAHFFIERLIEMELTNKKMTQYLETISKLETSVYEQEQCYKNAKARIVYEEPVMQELSVPVKQEIRKPSPDFSQEFLMKFSIFTLLFACIFLPVGIVSQYTILTVLSGFIFLCSITLLIYSLVQYKKEKELYPYELDKYNTDVQQAETDYASAMEAYKKDVETRNEEHRIAVKKAREAFAFAEQSLQQLVPPLNQTKEILKQYYDLDIIHPKYRNLAAVSTICEYFQTGRCDELIGANGAYNLYESELRQNIIINRLDNVVNNLEQIKANQYLLYMELKKASDNIEAINMSVDNLLDVSKRIAASSAITAYCAEVTAFNSTAMTAMSLFG